MSSADLLPPNSTLLERALAKAGSPRLINPDRIRTLWNADYCPAEFLPYLGWSLSVDFWELATTDEERRELIRGAIQWHRKRGTPWAIKQSLAAFGYPVIELVEQATYYRQWIAAGGHVLDGNWLLDGSVTLNPPDTGLNAQLVRRAALSHWAQYSIRLDATAGIWSREHQRKIRLVAKTFAPGRSHLVALIASLQMRFDAHITLKSIAARMRTRLTRCKRFQPAARRTLDGCWSLSGGEVPQMLDGGWSLDGRSLDGRSLTGLALGNGHIETRQTIKLRLSMVMGGPRHVPLISMGEQWPALDGSWSLDQLALQGWRLDEGQKLGNTQLDHLALHRLDGTWLLGGDQGGAGMWFSCVMRTKHNGITYQESL